MNKSKSNSIIIALLCIIIIFLVILVFGGTKNGMNVAVNADDQSAAAGGKTPPPPIITNTFPVTVGNPGVGRDIPDQGSISNYPNRNGNNLLEFQYPLGTPLSKIDLYVDSALYQSRTFGPTDAATNTIMFLINHDTAAIGKGMHSVYALAYATDGNISQSNTIHIYVNNTTHFNGWNIFNPKNGATISGTYTLRSGAFLAQNSGTVTKVEFYADGKLLGNGTAYTLVAGIYEYVLDTTKLSNGTHQLMVKAYGSGGDVVTSLPDTVTVAN